MLQLLQLLQLVVIVAVIVVVIIAVIVAAVVIIHHGNGLLTRPTYYKQNRKHAMLRIPEPRPTEIHDSRESSNEHIADTI